MNDIRLALENIADQIQQARLLITAEEFMHPTRLRELNWIALALISAQHAVMTALSIARRI